MQRLVSGAHQLGLAIDDEQAFRLLAYLACLDRWNRVHNLSAQATLSHYMVQHVFDSMTLVGPLTRHAKGRSLRVLDAGSGSGFPAVVVAALRPDWAIAAVDAVAKKVAFVRQAAAEAGIANLTAHHDRLEHLQPVEGFDVVVSRAFASLDKLIASTGRLLVQNGVWVAMKGRAPSDEFARLNKGVEVFHVEPVTVPELNAERNLIWMRRTTP
ncbi:MAG TPA: 16S rRNA (guanine(527)-N(7))-methyltransferase RsmG [Burkholderiaceae bacterium]|nr:16S rRNA (guanine(527)-N(7))-methyltransferase RsmG [Burkholderiaceae bacterium]